jgi:hypothetical protein
VSALDLLGIGFPLSGTVVVGVLWWLFKDALPVTPEDGIGGGQGDNGGSDRTPPRPMQPWSRLGGHHRSPQSHGERRDGGRRRRGGPRDRSRGRVRPPG